MKTITIVADGSVLIREGKQDLGRKHIQKESTSVYITKNIDVATVTFGTVDSDGTFSAFPDGAISASSKINHGPNIELWVTVSGITSNPVEIRTSS